ncbi:MAG: c-type cytochrome [Planctomycetota bacterium]
MATKRKTDHAFNIKRLNVVFLFSAVALTASVIWMVIDDYDREWKKYQREFFDLDRTKAEREIQEIDERNHDAVVQAQKAKEAALEKVQGDLESKRTELDLLQREKMYKADQDVKFARAEVDVLRYEYEKALAEYRDERGEEDIDPAEYPPSVREPYDAVLKQEAKVLDYLNVYNTLRQDETRLKEEVGELEKQYTVYDDELRKLNERRDILARKIETTSTNLKNILLDRTPMLDFVDPITKVEWVKPPELRDDLNFAYAERIDMCKTCHMAIDSSGYVNDEWEQPFRSHPRLDLYLTASSPHPYNEFGCTVCHQGRGQDLTFNGSAHMPQDEEQRHEWEEKYGWTPKAFKYWETPMVPNQYIYSSCLKCHGDSWEVPEAGPMTVELAAASPDWNQKDDGATTTDHYSLNAGRMIFYEYGCHGCHAIKDLENPRKVGPDLRHLEAKVEPDWVYSWLLDPKAFRPSTKMPKFFGLANNGGEMDTRADHELRHAWNEVEADAITAFLFKQSLPMEMAVPSDLEADAENGKRLFENRGCLGCHAVDSLPFAPANDFGPNLSRVGEKLNLAWLFNWVQNPKAYHPGGRMPSLRLDDQEAFDIATYVLEELESDAEFGAQPNRSSEQYTAFLDERLTETYLENLPMSAAEAKVAAMSLDQKRELFGQKLVERYGCAGCHMINGYEDAKGIGVELSEHGTKDLHTVDFGLELHEVEGKNRVTGEEEHYHIDHTLHSWLSMKIRYPRIFDRGRLKAFKDASRMPNFELTDEQIQSLITYILGNRKEPIPETIQNRLQGDAEVIAKGDQIIHDSNCYGCHQFEMHEITYLDDDVLPRHGIGQVTEISIDDEATFFRLWTDQVLITQKEKTESAAAQQLYGEYCEPSGFELFSHLTQLNIQAGEDLPLTAVEVQEQVGGTLELTEDSSVSGPVSLFTALTFLDEKNDVQQVFGRITDTDLDEGIVYFGLMKPGAGKDAFEDLEVKMDRIVRIVDPSLALGGRLGRALELTYAQNEDLNPFDIDEYYNDIQPTIDPYKPPVLFREGQKVQTPWLFDFLMSPYPLRPWFEVRMPTFEFTQEEATILANYFGARDRRRYPYSYNAESQDDYLQAHAQGEPSEYIEKAWALMQDPQVNCFNCHMQGEKTPEGDPSSWAPDLSMAYQRLRPDWIRAWIFNPQAFQPGTKMPQLFLADEARYQETYGAPSGVQVEAIKDLLMNWAQSPGAASNPR